MRIKTTITVEHTLSDDQVAEFKSRVFEYIQEEVEDCTLTLDDISNAAVEEFLSKELPNIIEDLYRGYDRNSGITTDDYFGTIGIDYYGEDVYDLIVAMADQILGV